MPRAMAREPAHATRYDAVVATFIGVLALLVSAYTAYTQRQQVRAQVWPYVEIMSNTEPAMSIIASPTRASGRR